MFAWLRPKRDAYRTAMMDRIRDAAAEGVLFKGSSLTDGLRCIRTFERVNGIPFDPFDQYHRMLVRGMGAHESIHRRLRQIRGAA